MVSHGAYSRLRGTPLPLGAGSLSRLTLNQGCSRVCSALGLLRTNNTG